MNAALKKSDTAVALAAPAVSAKVLTLGAEAPADRASACSRTHPPSQSRVVPPLIVIALTLVDLGNAVQRGPARPCRRPRAC